MVKKKTGDYPIPFDDAGNQMSYPSSWANVSWVHNFEFEDTLSFMEFSRGRSSAIAVFKRQCGTTVNVFLTDLHDIMPCLENGQVKGTFTFVKRGENYACRKL